MSTDVRGQPTIHKVDEGPRGGEGDERVHRIARAELIVDEAKRSSCVDHPPARGWAVIQGAEANRLTV